MSNLMKLPVSSWLKISSRCTVISLFVWWCLLSERELLLRHVGLISILYPYPTSCSSSSPLFTYVPFSPCSTLSVNQSRGAFYFVEAKHIISKEENNPSVISGMNELPSQRVEPRRTLERNVKRKKKVSSGKLESDVAMGTQGNYKVTMSDGETKLPLGMIEEVIQSRESTSHKSETVARVSEKPTWIDVDSSQIDINKVGPIKIKYNGPLPSDRIYPSNDRRIGNGHVHRQLMISNNNNTSSVKVKIVTSKANYVPSPDSFVKTSKQTVNSQEITNTLLNQMTTSGKSSHIMAMLSTNGSDTKQTESFAAHENNILQVLKGFDTILGNVTKPEEEEHKKTKFLKSVGGVVFDIPKAEGCFIERKGSHWLILADIDGVTLQNAVNYLEEHLGDVVDSIEPAEPVELQSFIKESMTPKMLKAWSFADLKPELEKLIPKDPEFKKYQYNMYTGRVVQAWLSGYKGNANVIIGVIDSGGDTSHEDLSPSLHKTEGENFDGRDDNGDGFVDNVYGYDFNGDSGSIKDNNGHGTHCAGTIGAAENGKGIVGVCNQSKMIILKFMDEQGKGDIANAVQCLDYLAVKGAHVSSNSWGTSSYSISMLYSIYRLQNTREGKGTLVVTASGNEHSNNDVTFSYPSSYVLDNIISVAAVDENDKLASFSNYGKRSVHVAAPGVKIMSTDPGNTYKFLSGTSMATPLVSGVAALVYSAFLDQGYEPHYLEVKEILRLTTRKVDQLENYVMWGGVVDAEAAVSMTKLGGLWIRVGCSQTTFVLPPQTSNRVDMDIYGILEGNFSADLQIKFLDLVTDESIGDLIVPIGVQSHRNEVTSLEVEPFPIASKEIQPNSDFDTVRLCDLEMKFRGYMEGNAGKLSTTMIIVISISSLIGLILLIFLGYTLYWTSRRRRARAAAKALAEEKAKPEVKENPIKASDQPLMVSESSWSDKKEA